MRLDSASQPASPQARKESRRSLYTFVRKCSYFQLHTFYSRQVDFCLSRFLKCMLSYSIFTATLMRKVILFLWMWKLKFRDRLNELSTT